ncbi:MAG: DUF4190 domain-containing protein [Acidimicrobiia bacterium]|nr:DUF4190 domain-containing protein [Acidimicrobiia bacterium]
MDRYDREERSYERGERDLPDSGSSDSSGDFPWQDSGAGDQPPEVWEEPPETPGEGGGPGGRDGQGNPLAIAGFVCSLVMWIPIPFTAPLFWLMALTFSSIGLSRSRRRGAPHKGLAIAGLCISLIGVVFVILLILFFVGASVFGE